MQIPGLTASVINMDAGGTYDWSLTASVMGQSGTIKVKGSYSLQGDKLKVNITSTDASNMPEMMAAQADGVVKQYMNQFTNATIQWISDDEVGATFENGQALTLKRRK